MIVYHNVIGSMDTSFHTFDITTDGMDVTISDGEYHQAGQQKFVAEEGATVSIPSPSTNTNYQVWLTETGIQVIYEDDVTEYAEVIAPIDCLAWFSVPASANTLDDIDIHVIRTVEG